MPRASSSAHALAEAATLLACDTRLLAECLGVSSRDVGKWLQRGVPFTRKRDVARLAQRAAALCRALPPDTAVRLLALSRQRSEAVHESANVLDSLARAEKGTDMLQVRRTARGVVITSR